MKFNTSKIDLAMIIVTMFKNEVIHLDGRYDTDSLRIHMDCFENCREQGFMLHISNFLSNEEYKQISVAFSENRNSDDIVVYYSNKYESGGNYSDEFWNNRKFFRYNEHYQASEYIVELTKTILELKKEN